MTNKRSSGVLLHPTSLPGPYGIGELGPQAIRFLDYLAGAHQQWWQVLPLGPTGYGDSPYQSFSSFAGNPLLISIQQLLAQHLLSPSDIGPEPPFVLHSVDYGQVIPYKLGILNRSFQHFKSGLQPHHFAAFETFSRQHTDWLDDYALFAALKEVHGGAIWTEWEPDIARREPDALQRWKQDLSDVVHRHKYLQYLFYQQWGMIREEAHRRGHSLDRRCPDFCGPRQRRRLGKTQSMFHLDDHGNPTGRRRRPPRLLQFHRPALGQSPVSLGRAEGTRVRLVDSQIEVRSAVRGRDSTGPFPRFRGLLAGTGPGETTAINGRWVLGPGADLFAHLQAAFGSESLPLIAEDLGVITDGVIALREAFHLPGMKILQFSFSGGVAKMEAPYRFPPNCVVYTGTHDNDTALGWFQNSSQWEERQLALKYMGTDGSQFHWDLIRLALSSVADTAVIPLQDLLGLGSEARMNYPSRAEGNWRWRFQFEQVSPDVECRLAEMTRIYGRSGDVL